MSANDEWSEIHDPCDFTPRHPGLKIIAEMPAKIESLQTIDGEVWAVLKGGATIRVSDLTGDEATGTVQ
jgi:hypothetical protein